MTAPAAHSHQWFFLFISVHISILCLYFCLYLWADINKSQMFISAEIYKHDMNAFICLYMFIPSISVNICTYACICSYVCICQYPSISVHICAYVYICKHVCICLYKFISVHMCVSVHMVVSVNNVNRFQDQPRINPYVSISVHIWYIST